MQHAAAPRGVALQSGIGVKWHREKRIIIIKEFRRKILNRLNGNGNFRSDVIKNFSKKIEKKFKEEIEEGRAEEFDRKIAEINMKTNKQLADDLELTHGQAAKLLNVYMKEFLFSEIKCKARKVVHPPVDRILLDKVRRKIIERRNDIVGAQGFVESLLDLENQDHEQWTRVTSPVKKWTKLESDDYQAIINTFWRLTNDVGGLWKIEKFWTPKSN